MHLYLVAYSPCSLAAFFAFFASRLSSLLIDGAHQCLISAEPAWSLLLATGIVDDAVIDAVSAVNIVVGLCYYSFVNDQMLGLGTRMEVFFLHTNTSIAKLHLHKILPCDSA